MPFWVKGLLFGALVFIIEDTAEVNLFIAILSAVLIFFIVNAVVKKKNTPSNEEKIVGLLLQFENSSIEIPRGIAYFGGRLANLVVNEFNLKLDRIKYTQLELFLMAVLNDHMIRTLKVNHMGSAFDNTEFKDNMTNEILAVVRSENKTISNNVRNNIRTLFLDYSSTLKVQLINVNEISIAVDVAHILIQELKLDLDELRLSLILKEPLRMFNTAVARRLKKSLDRIDS